MKISYLLTVTDEETGETIAMLDTYSEESLLEQLRKVDHAVAMYKAKKEQAVLDEMAVVVHQED